MKVEVDDGLETYKSEAGRGVRPTLPPADDGVIGLLVAAARSGARPDTDRMVRRAFWIDAAE